MDYFKNINIPISAETARTYFNVSLTILIAVFIDNMLRSFVKVPKNFDNKRAQTYITIFRNIITAIVYLIAVHIVLAELNINITPLLASAGIMGVVIGIGARPIIEDLITGLFLISQDKIAVGDYIKIDDIEGHIESIGFRTLTIRSGDGALNIIPNGMVKKLSNYSRHKANVTVTLTVKSDQKIDLVFKAAEEALTQLRKDTTINTALFTGTGVNGIENIKEMNIMLFSITLVTNPSMRWEIARQYRYHAKKVFEKYKLQFA